MNIQHHGQCRKCGWALFTDDEEKIPTAIDRNGFIRECPVDGRMHEPRKWDVLDIVGNPPRVYP